MTSLMTLRRLTGQRSRSDGDGHGCFVISIALNHCSDFNHELIRFSRSSVERPRSQKRFSAEAYLSTVRRRLLSSSLILLFIIFFLFLYVLMRTLWSGSLQFLSACRIVSSTGPTEQLLGRYGGRQMSTSLAPPRRISSQFCGAFHSYRRTHNYGHAERYVHV